jgi:hypothetical protein
MWLMSATGRRVYLATPSFYACFSRSHSVGAMPTIAFWYQMVAYNISNIIFVDSDFS